MKRLNVIPKVKKKTQFFLINMFFFVRYMLKNDFLFLGGDTDKKIKSTIILYSNFLNIFFIKSYGRKRLSQIDWTRFSA